MKNKNPAQYLFFTSLLIGVFAFSFFSLTLSARQVAAESIGDLRQQSEQLESGIASNEAAAEKKDKKADTLQEAVNELDGQIADTSQQISDTAGRIDELTRDLEQKQAELEKAKKLLKCRDYKVWAVYERHYAKP